MEVVLLILKIIGIILLCLIGLALLFFLLVFLWPFSYRFKVHKDETEFYGAVRILWLLGLLTATVTYDGEAKLTVRLLGIPVYKFKIWPTEEKTDTAEDENTALNNNSDNNRTNEDTATDNTDNAQRNNDINDSYVSEGEFFDDTYEESEMLTDEELDREIEERLADSDEEDTFDKLPFVKKIKAFILKIKELILKLRDKCYNIKDSIRQFIDNIKKKYKEVRYYYRLIQHPSVKPALLRLWKTAKKFLKHIRPRRLRATIEFGSGDPASTMKVYGYYCMIYPFYGKQIQFTPDMENKVFKADASISGRFQMLRMMLLGWSIFTDKNVRKLIRLIRREVKKRGRK